MQNSRFIVIYLLLACAIFFSMPDKVNGGQQIDNPDATSGASEDYENCQGLLNSDSTAGAKQALVKFFKDDPQLSIEKKWKRIKKWNVGNLVHRSFRAEDGRVALVVFNLVSKTNSVSLGTQLVGVTAIPKIPPNHFLFAIDNAGMSADESGGASVVIVSRKQFEELAWVEDHMDSSDRELLHPVIFFLGLTENMSNEFQAPKRMAKAELKRRLIELGLIYDQDLQAVVDEMGQM